jgi:hypothetical protein
MHASASLWVISHNLHSSYLHFISGEGRNCICSLNIWSSCAWFFVIRDKPHFDFFLQASSWLHQKQVRLGMPKFGPEPQFKPWTPKLNLQFWFDLVLVLFLLSRFGPRFGTSRIYVNSVWTCSNREPTQGFWSQKISENLVRSTEFQNTYCFCSERNSRKQLGTIDNPSWFACNAGPNNVIWDSVSFLADCFALYFYSNDVMIIDDHENALHAHPCTSNDKRWMKRGEQQLWWMREGAV